MKHPRRPCACAFHHGFLPMAPGGTIGFIGSVGGKGRIMLAQKGCFPRRAKMRDTGRDAERGGIKKRRNHRVRLSNNRRIIGVQRALDEAIGKRCIFSPKRAQIRQRCAGFIHAQIYIGEAVLGHDQ